MNTQPAPVVIIGGGVTGLAAAWHCQQQGVDYVLLEASDRFGGKVHTETIETEQGPVVLDGGAETFITRKRAVWNLVQELGMQSRVVVPGSLTSVYIVHDDTPIRMPLDPISFITSPIMSLGGKIRLLVEPFVKARRDDGDESLAEFGQRRLGAEATERMIAPVLAGIYNADPETQSILTTADIMRTMETDHGSIFLAAIARVRAALKAKRESVTKPPSAITFAGGAAAFVDELVAQLTGDVRSNAPVTCLGAHDNGVTVELATGELIAAQAVIVTVPGPAAANMLSQTAPQASTLIGALPYGGIGTVGLVYRTADLGEGLGASGMMIPRKEGRHIDAVTWPAVRTPDRAPEGLTPVRAFFGGADPTMLDKSDADLLAAVRRDLADLLDITAEPLETIIFRWDDFPAAHVGHLNRVDAIEQALPENIAVAGAAYRGVGVPDCIRQGREAAQRIITQVKHTV